MTHFQNLLLALLCGVVSGSLASALVVWAIFKHRALNTWEHKLQQPKSDYERFMEDYD